MSNGQTCDPSKCKAYQAQHHTAATLERHETELIKLFEKTDDLDNRTAMLEGKFTIYFYLSLGFLGTLIIISLYSYLQLMEFKKEYREDMKDLISSNNNVLREGDKLHHQFELRIQGLEKDMADEDDDG